MGHNAIAGKVVCEFMIALETFAKEQLDLCPTDRDNPVDLQIYKIEHVVRINSLSEWSASEPTVFAKIET